MDKYTHRHKENVKGSFLWGSIIAILFIIIFALTSCHLKKSVTVKNFRAPYNGEVTVLEAGSTVPEGAIFLGDIFVGEAGMTPRSKCTYEKCMAACLKETQKMGGNYFVITNHTYPNWWGSTCHGINGSVYYYKAKKNKRTEDEED